MVTAGDQHERPSAPDAPVNQTQTTLKPNQHRIRKGAALIILAATLVRLGLAATLGFGVDEAYTLAVTRQFQLSWFDHPPLAFWLAYGGQQLWGVDAAHALLRLPFVLLMSGSSVLLYRLAERLYGAQAGLWALISFTLAPFFMISAGSWIVPDGAMIFFLLLAANSLAHLLFEPTPPHHHWRLWLFSGVCIGLAGLSKYLAVFFPLGLGLFLLTSPHHRAWLRHPAPWLSAALAMLVLAPVFVWNSAHHWISFIFQGSRASAQAHWRPDYVLTMLGGEAAYLLPWTCGGLLIAAFLSLRTPALKAQTHWLLWLALPALLILTLLPVRGSSGLPHWPMVGWLFLFPLLGRWISDLHQRGKNLHKITLTLSLITMSLLIILGGTQARYGWLRQLLPVQSKNQDSTQKNQDPTHELIDWQGLHSALAQRGLLSDANYVIATRWLDGGRIARQLPNSQISIWDNDPRGFAFLPHARGKLGQSALILSRNLTAEQIKAQFSGFFMRIEALAPIAITRNGHTEFELRAYHAHQQTRPFPLPYGEKP